MVSRSPQDDATGFEAAAFGNGTTLANSTEIVISFAGTYDKPLNPFTNPDLQADISLATGFGSDQLAQAADYFLSILAAYPNAQITLTGHSLGGGLAALVSVFFGVPAWTFDQAPFAKSAEYGFPPDVAANLKTYLLGRGYTESNLSALTSYLQQRDVSGGIPNQNFLTNLSVEGEFLSVAPLTLFNRIGTEFFIRNRTEGLSGTDLHSQSLLAAYLQSEKTAEQGKALNDVTYKLTDLLAMIFDKNLYAFDTDLNDRNFLEHIVRHEAGVQDSFIADAMVTRFTQDLWKLAQDGGLTLSDGNLWNPALNNLSKALTAFAMQKYYDETPTSAGYNKTLFTNIDGGGIQFDRADVVATLGAAKGDKYFQAYLLTSFTPVERNLINSILPLLRDWTIQAGTAALNAADTQNRNALLLGGSGSDGLVGGSGADLLVGNAGADLLQGKGGNDILLGGSGDDTYVYSTGDGLDTLLDTAGQNTLAVDGDILSGGAEYGDGRVHRSADGKHFYVETGGRMLIDGNLVIQNYATGGSFGLTMTGPLADATLPALTGSGADNFIGTDIYYRNPDNSTIYRATLADGTTEVAEPFGSGAANILEGKAGLDILSGGGNNDRLYADSQIGVAEAIANGNIIDSGSGLKGDWLAGGDGDDTLVAGIDNDVLSGGAGSDLLIGGAGDDDILGDTDWVATSFDWTVTDSNGVRVFYPAAGTQAPPDGAADVIYAGEGNDYVWAGAGNDVVFGEGGDDRLNGNEGNDIQLGGAGNDQLWGNIGSDYLDGGAGADQIQGNEGDDILIGGAGTDTIWGGAGRDTYIFNKGDGVDEIWDDDIGPEKSILVFGEGFDPNSIKLRKGSLLLDLGDGDAIHIENFDAENPLGTQNFSSFQFADGTSLTWSELLARGFDLDGTDQDDEILGTNTTDRIDGRAGNDTIWGLDGDDILTGGTGTDCLDGGLGDDSYIVHAGDAPADFDLGLIEAIVDHRRQRHPDPGRHRSCRRLRSAAPPRPTSCASPLPEPTSWRSSMASPARWSTSRSAMRPSPPPNSSAAMPKPCS
jgi:Ca2+-binding RTX toxin-like protein